MKTTEQRLAELEVKHKHDMEKLVETISKISTNHTNILQDLTFQCWGLAGG